MTCIAWDGKILAADSKVSGDCHGHWADQVKIRNINGYLIGAAGTTEVVNWFLSKFDPRALTGKVVMTQPANQLKDDDLIALIITPKGKIFFCEEKLLFTPVKAKYVAIGSGESAASGAMYMGASAIQAVKAAIKHDGNCGGRIKYYKLGG